LEVLIGAEVQLVEGVGVGYTACTLVYLLTAGIDAFSLMTTFEGPGADISSLAAFKVVRMFLSIAKSVIKQIELIDVYFYLF
jgi:hypothetical protein